MAETKDETMKAQVENRLDYLFDEDQDSPHMESSSGEFSLSPLKPLKAILLSVDWEITDETMASLLREVKNLEETYRGDKIPHTFLQILASIGKYVNLNKGKAHPDTIQLMDSVYKALEKVVMSEVMTQEERERLLLAEVAKFKKLKEAIAFRREKRKEETSEESVGSPVPEESEKPWVPPYTAQMSAHEAFVFALEEIKDLIKAEFKALRAEIKLWRGSE